MLTGKVKGRPVTYDALSTGIWAITSRMLTIVALSVGSRVSVGSSGCRHRQGQRLGLRKGDDATGEFDGDAIAVPAQAQRRRLDCVDEVVGRLLCFLAVCRQQGNDGAAVPDDDNGLPASGVPAQGAAH